MSVSKESVGFVHTEGLNGSPTQLGHAMGGAWERMTKAAHQILKALLKRAVLSQGARKDRREEKSKLRQHFLNGQL